MLTCNICGHTAKTLGWHIKNVHISKVEFDEATRLVEQKFTAIRLKELYETGHTPAIIAKHFVIPELGLVHKRISNILKVILPYEKEYYKIHLSKPVWWRWKWALGVSDEEAKRISHERNSSTLAKTAEKRRNSEYGYTKQYSTEYWLSTGLSQQEASDTALTNKRMRSPRIVEFWMKKGLTLEQAKEKVSMVCSMGAVAACQKLSNNFTSSLETKVAAMLDELGISYERQHFITDGAEKYLYDFKIENVILEINGTYWHADPRVYGPKDVNKVMGMTAAQIWEQDAKKRRLAALKGFKFVTIWEIDIVKLTKDELKSIVG